MKVFDLNDKETEWRPKGKSKGTKVANRSKLHLHARKLLREQYGSLVILEEVPFQAKGRKRLYFDFYIPVLKIAIEPCGEQHYKFNRFFHSNNLAFYKQKRNDRWKAEWCELNNILLIVLPFDEIELWPKLLQKEWK